MPGDDTPIPCLPHILTPRSHLRLAHATQAVETSYPSTNQYHTSLHAADVTASLCFFLNQSRLERQLGPLDWLAALLAAFVHDAGHPGVNNSFLEATHADFAITYNDQSVLENHHAALAFWLARNEASDWMSGLEGDTYRDLRETMCVIILGTEMKSHFEHLNKFKSRSATEGFCTGEKLERKDLRLLLLMALHAADMSNPTKPIALAIEWAARAMDEFFSQVMMPPLTIPFVAPLTSHLTSHFTHLTVYLAGRQGGGAWPPDLGLHGPKERAACASCTQLTDWSDQRADQAVLRRVDCLP